MQELLIFVKDHFSMEIYMLSTRTQGIIWSIADVILILFILKTVNLVRNSINRKKIRIRYFLLFVSLLLTPMLLYVESSNSFLHIESIICGIQFLILLYTILYDRKVILEFLVIYNIIDRNEKTNHLENPLTN